MNGKLYIKKFIRDDGETLSFDAEEIYLSENNTLLVRSDPATTAVEFTEEDGGEMIRQRGATYSQPVSGLIVPKSTEYWALCVRLSRFFILNHTYKIVYIKRDGSMFSMNRAWINAGLQIVPVPYENYSTWTIEFRIGDNFWTEYAEDSQGKEIYSNTVELPLLTAGTGGEVWSDATQQTLSGLGNYFTIDGTSISASINELEVRGDTSQQTYNGKNKINGSYSEISQTVRCTAEESGNGFKITPTASSGATYVTVPLPNIASLLGQTVTISYVATGDGIRARFFYLNSSGGATGSIGTTETITLPDSLGSNSGIGVVFYTSNNSSATYNDIQVEIGSTSSAYEQYVGGTPSPNPDYPQNVQTVTGTQTVKITGKNLQYVANSFTQNGITFTHNADGSITINGTSTDNAYYNLNNTQATRLTLKAGTTYTISTGGVKLPQNNVMLQIRKANPNVVYASITGNTTSRTWTMSEDAETYTYIGVYGSGVTLNNLTIYPQLEVGSVATDFEAYRSQTYTVNLGSTELCQIGGYQDSIYKSGNDWYVHKAMGKITLDGSETWSATRMANNWLYYTTNTGMAVVTSSQMPNIISNYFSVTTTDRQWTSTTGSKSVTLSNTASPNTQIRFTVGDSTNKLADFKTWLSAHNTIVYYALATPTETKITNTTLRGQLNALAGAQAYSGKTVYQTDSATMPAILSVELLQSVGGGEVWDNVGAVWEEGVGGVQTINVETTQTTYPVWTVTGPCSNPTLQNDTTDTLASFDGMIASGQTLTVNFADNTAYLDSAPVAKYVSGYVSLAPGENVIGFNSDGGSTQTSTISWDNIIN